MEYVFQITKETPQNINLDFQLKAMYGIDFWARVTHSETVIVNEQTFLCFIVFLFWAILLLF